ncbi:PAS domain-containing sensor histidine kinase [Gammaproteobacteria bacterium]|nr:PAS domain-containing sensor histidine kinase [Gammaproteobacteria bacterium]
MVDTVTLLERINDQRLKIVHLEQAVSEHKKSLRESQIRQMAFEKSMMMLPQPFYWVSPMGLIQACSQSFATLCHVSSPELLLGKNIFDVLCQQGMDNTSSNLIAHHHACVLKQDKTLVAEESIRCAGKSPKNWLSYRQAIKSASGQVIGLVAVIFDVTQRKNQDIEQQASRVKQAFDHVGSVDFLVKSKHDIKTPLMNLIGLTQIIQSQDPKNEILRDAMYSAKQLERMIEEILDFAAKKCFDEPNHRDEFSVAQLIEEIKGTIRLMVEDNRIEFSTVLSDDVCRYIRTNRVRLQRIITNLLVNAIKHARTDYLELSVSPSTHFQDMGLKIRVKDHGVGIPEQHLSDVLYGKRMAHGRMIDDALDDQGLGLGIIYEYTQQLGGTVDVCSQVGVGTEFIIHVPYEPALDVLEV